MVDGPTEAIARRVSELRKLRGLTKQELGDKLAELGMNWNRFTVGSLEGGKRQGVSVGEWLALARALDVAPLSLLLPLGTADLLEILPGTAVHPDLARKWIVGEEEPTNAQRIAGGDSMFWHRQTKPLRLFARLNVSQQEVHRARSDMRVAERIGHPDALAAANQTFVAALRGLADVLGAMVEAQLTPPAMPGAWLDEMVELGMLSSLDRIPRLEE